MTMMLVGGTVGLCSRWNAQCIAEQERKEEVRKTQARHSHNYDSVNISVFLNIPIQLRNFNIKDFQMLQIYKCTPTELQLSLRPI